VLEGSFVEISEVLDAYCDGIYSGDVERLRSAFHASAILWGEVKGLPYHRPLDEYLNIVRNRQSPQVLGESYGMKTLAIEIQGNIALAKVRCRMLGYNYTDFLSLLYQDNRWGIVAKLFTHLEPDC
jgi:Putative lumazine-binding